MNVEELERAIVGFESLLAESPEDEAPFQNLFEEHPVVLESLGYAETLSRPRLPLREGGWYEPDFLAQRASGLWEIVDLKTPAEIALRGLDRRERFTAKAQSYISQVHEYDEYFDDFDRRRLVLEEFGADVQRRPAKVLILGRDEDTDKREVHHQLSRLASSVSLLTYDDVLLALVQQHSQLAGDNDPGSGLSMFLHLSLSNPDERRRGYIFDFVGRRGNRLSLFLNERRRLVLEVVMDDGETLAVPIEVPPHSSAAPVLVSLEAGVRGEHGVMQLRIEDSIAGQLVLSGNDIRRAMGFDRELSGTTSTTRRVVGSD